MFTFPKDDASYEWTSHVKSKMVQYRLSKSIIVRVIRYPKRTEEGIAPKTVAVMQTKSNSKKPEEIWVMYRENPPSPRLRGARKLIISAWRYPGVSTPGKKIFIPEDIITELEKWFKK